MLFTNKIAKTVLNHIAAVNGGKARRIKYSVLGALGLAAALGANPASATVQVTNVALAGTGNSFYTVKINGETVYDTALLLTVDGKQIFANCDDIFHNISVGQAATFSSADFSTSGTASNLNGGTYTAAQAGSMSWLLGTGAAIWQAGASSTENMDLAALQLASWMVGNPTASFSNYDCDVYKLAEAYIAQAAGQSALPGESVTQLTSSAGVQGQLVLNQMTPAVPEPSSWALMLTGFGMVGAGLRKRTSASQIFNAVFA